MNTSIRSANGFSKSLLSVALLGAFASSQALAYELIDLGEFVEPKAINDAGVVVPVHLRPIRRMNLPRQAHIS